MAKDDRGPNKMAGQILNGLQIWRSNKEIMNWNYFNIEQKTSYEVSILFGFGTDSEDSSSWVIRYNRYGESLAIEFGIFYTADIEV